MRDNKAGRDQEKIRIVICNPYTLFREGIKAMFPPESPIEVVGEAEAAKKMHQMVRRLHPDLVLMDTRLSDSSGTSATRQIKALDPHVKVLIVSMSDDEPLIESCLTAGASGFIRHDAQSDELKQAILMACGRGVRAA